MNEESRECAGFGQDIKGRMRRACCAAVVCTVLAVSLVGCHSARAVGDAAVPVLPIDQETSHAPVDASLHGSYMYRDCVAVAAGDGPGLERCLDDELVYRQGVLDRMVRRRTASVVGQDLEDLRSRQLDWQRETDRMCAGAEGAGVSRAQGTACRIDRIIKRTNALSLQVSESGAPYRSDVEPDINGSLEMRLGDAVVTLHSDECRTWGSGSFICSEVQLQINMPDRLPQVLLLPEVLLPRNTTKIPAATGYRGSMRRGFVDGRLGVMLTDVNVDGHEDLMVWSGQDGTYGDPSYTYFIYAPAAGQLVENTAIAEAMMAHSLSRIVDGQLFAWYRSGPCERGEKTIDVRGAAPRIVARRDYNTCEGDRPW